MKNHSPAENGFLDKMLLKSGSEALIKYFIETAQNDRAKAVALINDNRLRFTTLYILLPLIEKLNLYTDISPRNQIALNLCAKIITELKPNTDTTNQLSENTDYVHYTLQWMFITGAMDDGLCNEFDQILDIVAAHLTRTYQDTVILPELVGLIFRRNRKGLYIHDLVWALFGSCNPRIFRLIAVYLHSQRKADVKLATKLLRHEPGEENSEGTENRRQYKLYSSWLKENEPYLYFTREGFHQTSDPTPCMVDLGAKFICKKISPKSRKPLTPITEDDRNHLDEFSRMQSDEKILLSRYSH